MLPQSEAIDQNAAPHITNNSQRQLAERWRQDQAARLANNNQNFAQVSEIDLTSTNGNPNVINTPNTQWQTQPQQPALPQFTIPVQSNVAFQSAGEQQPAIQPINAVVNNAPVGVRTVSARHIYSSVPSRSHQLRRRCRPAAHLWSV
jgi:hypothetical protein